MWTCPKCETLNEDENCVICGEPKPEEPIAYHYEFDDSTKYYMDSHEENHDGVVTFFTTLIVIIVAIFVFWLIASNI